MKRSKTNRPLPIVAIDGPAGSGKTTVAKKVAARLGYQLIDTGAIYRCLALKALHSHVKEDDAEGLGKIAENLSIQFREEGGIQHVWLNSKDVTRQIREPEISQLASKVSVHPPVRRALLEMQRKFGREGGIVMEGRDIGTVIFPDAELKIFLVASAQVRALRRFVELQQQGHPVSQEGTLAEVKQRDARDENRDFAPLKPAPDAVIIDTQGWDADTVTEKIIQLVNQYLQGGQSE